MNDILREFGVLGEISSVPVGSGLIHRTWKITAGEKNYILQRINEKVFPYPAAIAYNIRRISEYLNKYHPGYNLVSPIRTITGAEIFSNGTGTYRLFPYVQGSHTIDTVTNPGQAWEAARQFARFTRLLAGFDPHQLKITIPFFHDLNFRFEQFRATLEKGNKERIEEASDLVKKIMDRSTIVTEYNLFKANLSVKQRVMHHDTKISNVLFDSNGKGICVIDLDTIMPGYFISDTGDMMRTYLSPASEEESDFSKIIVREDFYKAIVEGYLEEMNDELSDSEKNYFYYSGKFMIYMQAIRFLDDYLNDDLYYGASYSKHNLVRAGNQIILLERLLEFVPS